MFKKFVEQITHARNTKELLEIVYGPAGIDTAFQAGKITGKDHHRLLALIQKISGLMVDDI